MEVNFKISFFLEIFCYENGIHHTFLPQEHLNKMGLWREKNRSLKEGARTLLNETKLPKYF